MTVKERLIKYIQFKGISIREFCRTIGVSETYVTSMRSSIQPDKLVSVVEHYPDLNTIWLMTGAGDMINRYIEMPTIDRENLVRLSSEVFKDKLIAMFVSGEIVSASVVKSKDDIIRDLINRVAKLEDEIVTLKLQLSEYKQ